ncbi:conserved hypothetical protein [Planktothrix serta PCC 8927]|uniref:Uncharacterized protein n=1 Tax=Planktothrix serta PCC 8927 TaxID=671068 RepID=A0A7Z9BY39_9CYAN|nr:hypothetical protein [Planktothrix serta]VXD24918.1 conserved hypothetical protein [Planktothrix serta PCC 8927]
METITIKVENEVAKLYQEADINQQEKAIWVCSLILKGLLKPSSFDEMVKQVREEAKVNGLTPEILAHLLEDE